MKRSAMLAAVLAMLVFPAQAQRIELEGGNAGSAGSGFLGIETERDINGSLTIDTGRDGIGVEVEGEATMGVQDETRTLGGGVSLGTDTDAEQRPAETGPDDDGPARAGAPVSAEPDTTGEFCADSALFETQREAFLEQEPAETLAYIQRIDVSVCGYEGSESLVAHLSAIEGVRDGLEHMEIEPASIVSARWTDDEGLLVYTTGPAD